MLIVNVTQEGRTIVTLHVVERSGKHYYDGLEPEQKIQKEGFFKITEPGGIETSVTHRLSDGSARLATKALNAYVKRLEESNDVS